MAENENKGVSKEAIEIIEEELRLKRSGIKRDTTEIRAYSDNYGEVVVVKSSDNKVRKTVLRDSQVS